MRFKFFICLIVLLLPFCATAKDITAIGFVEAVDNQQSTRDKIRLAFVQTDSGWSSSCFFEKFHSLADKLNFGKLVSESSACSHQIMNKTWQIIDAAGMRLDVGKLKYSKAAYGDEIGFVSITKPLKTTLKFDSSGVLRQTWNGAYAPPLLAVPSETRIEKVQPKLNVDSVPAEIKSEIIRQYLTKKRKIENDGGGFRYATPEDIVIKPVYSFQDGITFCEVSMTISDTSYCDMTSTDKELFVVKKGQVKNISEKSGVRSYMCLSSLALFNRYVVITKDIKDSIFVLFASGYDEDGYVLLDSELNIRGVSTWYYH